MPCGAGEAAVSRSWWRWPWEQRHFKTTAKGRIIGCCADRSAERRGSRRRSLTQQAHRVSPLRLDVATRTPLRIMWCARVPYLGRGREVQRVVRVPIGGTRRLRLRLSNIVFQGGQPPTDANTNSCYARSKKAQTGAGCLCVQVRVPLADAPALRTSPTRVSSVALRSISSAIVP